MTDYKPSKFWEYLSRQCDDYLIKYGYENFKRSVGVVYNNYYVDDKNQLHDNYELKVKEFWDYLYKNLPNEILDRFSEPLVGNPLGIIYNGRFVSIDLGVSIAEYYFLYKHIDFSKVFTIHEIGGGYGRTAYVISQLHPDVVYRLYDIEPALGLAKRYLSDVLPNKKFEFYTPDKLSQKCDLFLALDCLHEMTKEQVENYFEYANWNASYFYYTCWKETFVPHDNITWGISDYPVRDTWKKLALRSHFTRDKFFEALYEI